MKRFYNRDDAKWGHPEIGTSYELASESMGFDTVFDDNLPLEERKAAGDAEMARYAEAVKPFDETRTTIYQAPGCPEEPDAPLVRMVVSQPTKPKKKRQPCILIIPGGGLGFCMSAFSETEEKADEFNCVAVTFDYRTVINGGGFPRTLNDCHAAYQYLTDHAEELHIHPDKIVIHGVSSGALLALALCHRLKRYGITPRGCLVSAPILDDRLGMYESTKIKSNGWGSDQLYTSNRLYLGKDMNQAYVPAEAFPNRATIEECIGLPPTFIHTYVNDTGLDPSFAYASKLSAAGVYVSLHAWGGSHHDALYTAATMYDKDNPDARYVQTYNHVFRTDFLDLLQYDLRRDWTTIE